MAELHVLTGAGDERVVPLAGAPVTFGRGDSCDVVLEENRASRTHCTFRPDGDGWRVVDEGSSNGTYLGGKPVLSARLQPGDELEIGLTVITYVAEAVTPVRQRRVVARRPAWGLLALPVVLGFAAYLGLGAFESASAQTREKRYEDAARTAVQRADLPSQASSRDAILAAFEKQLPPLPAATRARSVIASALAGRAGTAARDDSWRRGLTDLRGAWDHMAPVQRRARLAELLERHLDSPDAVLAIKQQLEELARDTTEHASGDRERTSRDAARATSEGRLADALDLWNGWLLRTPSRDHESEREVAGKLDEILALARAAAEKTLDEAQRLKDGGDADTAAAHVTAALQRLRGTGYDSWLAARTGGVRSAARGGVPALNVARTGATASSTKERALALRVLSSAEDLARLRRFDDAARRLTEALPSVTDAGLRSDLDARLADLRAEAGVVSAVLAQVAAAPRSFSPVRLLEGAFKVNGATENALLIAKGDQSAARTLGELPASVLAHLFDKARLDDVQLRAAAIVLWDVGESDAYTAMMRRALATEDDVVRNETSAVHARLLGRETPDGGYVPHPDADGGIITWDEFKEIQNHEKIAEYTKELTKIVASVETSKQAKQVERVRHAYAQLEAARNFALELIFDEVKYFYPYRDRMKEYMPVKLEVERRVKLVEEAWDSSAKAKPKLDAKMEGQLARADELRIEINYLGAPTDELDARLDAVTMYLGHELTVRTFFENDRDLKLHGYNAAVMADNAVKEAVATKDEREQVRITNEYRIMMGHRRALHIQDQLTLSARGHSADMTRLGFFDHFSPVPGKRAPADRIRKEGYPLAGASENIHRGSGDPMGAHLSWRGSSGHHRNLLMPAWFDMGTGRDGRNWTQNFGFTGKQMLED